MATAKESKTKRTAKEVGATVPASFNDHSLRVAVARVGQRAARICAKAAGDRPLTPELILRAAQALENGDRELGASRPWPTLAARLRKIVNGTKKSAIETKPREEEASAAKTIAPGANIETNAPPRTRATMARSMPVNVDAIENDLTPTAPVVTATVNTTLSELAEGFLRSLEAAKKSRGTIFSYSINANILVSHFGEDRPAASIKADEIAEFLNSDRVTKTRGGAPKSAITTAKIRRVALMMLEHGAREGLVDPAIVPHRERATRTERVSENPAIQASAS